MDFKEKFPNELWLEVFSYLPLDALRSLSSTQRALRDIARPLGFTNFQLCPHDHLHRHTPSQGQLDDAMERLRFWSSPEMAPHVRSSTASQDLPTRSPWHILINSFIQFLPRFTGLRRLHLEQIKFTQTLIVDLCGLPALTHAKFVQSRVRSREHLDPSALTLRVTTFAVEFAHDDRLGDLWISLLSRDTLQELYFSSLEFRPEFLPFQNLHTVGVKFWSPNTSAILPKFPQVRSFTSSGRTFGTLTPLERVSIFPILQAYTGIYENLGLFIQRATLTHITLYLCYFFQFLTALWGVKALPNTTSFTARFFVFETAGIDALFGFFPNLTQFQLTFTVDDGEFIDEPASVIKMLPSSVILPRTLESISLNWYDPEFMISDEEDMPGPPDPTELPDFACVRDTLIAKCPALTHLFLDGYNFLFEWRKTSSLVREFTAYSFDEAEVIRAKIRETSVPV
ncbi:hypothetical protein K438DRAFT_1777705 [Mycena galopus ATCC 62051]|nr:hypothetical protein K438DRAFT_1777705 [Mycena galopus ATCC 62051]